MLYLSTKKEFNYLNYLSAMSAVRFNEVIMCYVEEPESEWWKLVKAHKSILLKQMFSGEALSIDPEDNVGLLILIYLRKFTQDSTDHAMLKHECLYENKDTGEFERDDLDVIRVHVPEGIYLTPQWVKDSDTVLSDLIKTVLLPRIWNPYER